MSNFCSITFSSQIHLKDRHKIKKIIWRRQMVCEISGDLVVKETLSVLNVFSLKKRKPGEDAVTVFKCLKECNGDQIIDFVLCCPETECLKWELSIQGKGCLWGMSVTCSISLVVSAEARYRCQGFYKRRRWVN